MLRAGLESFFKICTTSLLHIDYIGNIYFTAGAYEHFMIYFGKKKLRMSYLQSLLFLRFSHKFKFFLFKLFFSLHIRSSRPKGLCKRSVLKNFAKFIGKRLCWSLFLIDLQSKLSDSNTGLFLWILWDF